MVHLFPHGGELGPGRGTAGLECMHGLCLRVHDSLTQRVLRGRSHGGTGGLQDAIRRRPGCYVLLFFLPS
jgi:hypothetical protein